jgi:hypothetical protein
MSTDSEHGPRPPGSASSQPATLKPVGSHDRGAADRGGPFVHPAGGKPGGGQLPACGKAVISR